MPVEKAYDRLRPYHPECTWSRLVLEAKRGWAWLVFGWEKTHDQGTQSQPSDFEHLRSPVPKVVALTFGKMYLW